MASTPSTRNRLEKQATGENSSTWGTKLNAAVIDLLDVALDGWSQITLTGDRTLTSANFVADESRARMLRLFGSGSFALTIPSVEKYYIVDNQLTGTLTLGTGSGDVGTVATGETAVVLCDAADVKALTIPAYKTVDAAGSVPMTGILQLLGSGETLRFGGRGGLASNGAGIEVLHFDRANDSGIHFDWTTGRFTFVFGGVTILSLDGATGNLRTAGTITPSVTP